MSRFVVAIFAVVAIGALLIPYSPASAQKPGPGGTTAFVDQQLAQLGQQLKLTAAQKAKIKPIIESTFKQAQVIQADKSLDQPKMMAKFQAMQKSVEAKIKAILTPEQQKKLAVLQKEAMARAKAANAARQPR